MKSCLSLSLNIIYIISVDVNLLELMCQKTSKNIRFKKCHIQDKLVILWEGGGG